MTLSSLLLNDMHIIELREEELLGKEIIAVIDASFSVDKRKRGKTTMPLFRLRIPYEPEFCSLSFLNYKRCISNNDDLHVWF